MCNVGSLTRRINTPHLVLPGPVRSCLTLPDGCRSSSGSSSRRANRNGSCSCRSDIFKSLQAQLLLSQKHQICCSTPHAKTELGVLAAFQWKILCSQEEDVLTNRRSSNMLTPIHKFNHHHLWGIPSMTPYTWSTSSGTPTDVHKKELIASPRREKQRERRCVYFINTSWHSPNKRPRFSATQYSFAGYFWCPDGGEG